MFKKIFSTKSQSDTKKSVTKVPTNSEKIKQHGETLIDATSKYKNDAQSIFVKLDDAMVFIQSVPETERCRLTIELILILSDTGKNTSYINRPRRICIEKLYDSIENHYRWTTINNHSESMIYLACKLMEMNQPWLFTEMLASLEEDEDKAVIVTQLLNKNLIFKHTHITDFVLSVPDALEKAEWNHGEYKFIDDTCNLSTAACRRSLEYADQRLLIFLLEQPSILRDIQFRPTMVAQNRYIERSWDFSIYLAKVIKKYPEFYTEKLAKLPIDILKKFHAKCAHALEQLYHESSTIKFLSHYLGVIIAIHPDHTDPESLELKSSDKNPFLPALKKLELFESEHSSHALLRDTFYFMFAKKFGLDNSECLERFQSIKQNSCFYLETCSALMHHFLLINNTETRAKDLKYALYYATILWPHDKDHREKFAKRFISKIVNAYIHTIAPEHDEAEYKAIAKMTQTFLDHLKDPTIDIAHAFLLSIENYLLKVKCEALQKKLGEGEKNTPKSLSLSMF